MSHAENLSTEPLDISTHSVFTLTYCVHHLAFEELLLCLPVQRQNAENAYCRMLDLSLAKPKKAERGEGETGAEKSRDASLAGQLRPEVNVDFYT